MDLDDTGSHCLAQISSKPTRHPISPKSLRSNLSDNIGDGDDMELSTPSSPTMSPGAPNSLLFEPSSIWHRSDVTRPARRVLEKGLPPVGFTLETSVLSLILSYRRLFSSKTSNRPSLERFSRNILSETHLFLRASCLTSSALALVLS